MSNEDRKSRAMRVKELAGKADVDFASLRAWAKYERFTVGNAVALADDVLALSEENENLKKLLEDVGARRVELEMQVIEFEKYLGATVVTELRAKARAVLEGK